MNLSKETPVFDRPEILVVCTHNAGRSVAARVLLDHYGAGRIVVRSAGSTPGDTINPAVAAMTRPSARHLRSHHEILGVGVADESF